MAHPATPQATAPQFVFEGLSLPDGEDPLGVWDLSSMGASSFTTGENGAGLRWRVSLPAEPEKAKAALEARRREIADRQSQLALIERRLAALTPSGQYPAMAGLSGLERYDAELLRTVEALRAPASVFAAEPEEARALYTQLYEACQELFTEFRRLLSHYARVETSFNGQTAALTLVDWTGDFETLWEVSATPAVMEIHLETVRLAMSSRQTFLRLIAVVTSGALALALKASVPGGQFLLIPAVYRYVREILKRLNELGRS
ncbi:MAG: hypothetical protein ACP5JG_15950 [Anaerolineae bacterium]